MGVTESGERRPLAPEVLGAQRIEEGDTGQLHGRGPLEPPVVPTGEPHGAHPALPQRPFERPGPDPVAGQGGPRAIGAGRIVGAERALAAPRSSTASSAASLAEQALDLARLVRLGLVQLGQPGGPLPGGQLERLIEQHTQDGQQVGGAVGHGEAAWVGIGFEWGQSGPSYIAGRRACHWRG